MPIDSEETALGSGSLPPYASQAMRTPEVQPVERMRSERGGPVYGGIRLSGISLAAPEGSLAGYATGGGAEGVGPRMRGLEEVESARSTYASVPSTLA